MANVAAIHAARHAKQRKRDIRAELKAHKEREERRLTEWFNHFDASHTGYLDENELRNLLTTLEPERAPTDEMVQFFVEKCKIGHPETAGIERGEVV